MWPLFILVFLFVPLRADAASEPWRCTILFAGAPDDVVQVTCRYVADRPLFSPPAPPSLWARVLGVLYSEAAAGVIGIALCLGVVGGYWLRAWSQPKGGP